MNKSNIIFGIFVLLMTSSCSRYYYQPSTVNAPLLSDKNQLHLVATAMSTNTDDDTDFSGSRFLTDVQAAYSPVKHLGIIGSFSNWNYRADNIDYLKGHVDAKARIGELGIGGYVSRGNKEKVQMIGDIYGGFGLGSLESDVDMNLTKFFIQPGIGMRHKVIDAAFNLRYSMIKFSDLNDHNRGIAYLTNQKLYDPQRQEYITDNFYGFIEPSFTMRVGYKFLKFQMNWTFSQELSYVPWNYNGSRFSMGAYFSLEDLINLSSNRKPLK